MRTFLLAVLALLLVRTCMGQVFEAGPSFDRWAAPVTTEEVRDLCADAGVNPETEAAAKTVVDGALGAIRREEHRMKRATEKVWLTHNRDESAAITELIQKAVARRAAAHEKIARTLLEDLRGLIPPEADEAWSRFERRRYRRLYMTQSWRMGVTHDLIEFAKTEKIEGPEVAPVLERYEIELDQLLRARIPIAATYDDRLQAAIEADNAPEIERVYAAFRDADCAILRLQRSTAAKLMAAVPEDRRGVITDKLLTARCPYVQTNTPLRERIEKLSKHRTLSQEQRRALGAALARYDHQSRGIDDRYLAQTEDSQCAWTYAQSQEGDPQSSIAWHEESRKAQAMLLSELERVVSEEQLDALDP